jgi:signal transduction histidine kinase
MTDRESAEPMAEPTGKRRRRRGRAPVEVVSETKEKSSAPTPVRAHRHWSSEALSSLGVSPIFRAYIFLGSIVAILTFLLYNESLTSELREQEKNRVDLYARLISFAPLATEEQTMTIFTQVINNPQVDFPCIITNFRGEITEKRGLGDIVNGREDSFFASIAFWRGQETAIAIGDSVYEKALRRLMRKMDAENAPIKYYLSSITPGRLYVDGRRVIITDIQGDIARWRGDGLPDEADTTAAALIQVRFALEQISARRPLEFAVPSEGFSYLHYDGMQAVITDSDGNIVTWRGHTLPAEDDKSPEALGLVRDRLRSMGDREAPLSFYIPAEHYIHYGSSDLVNRISLAPVVQIGVLLLFLLVGYIGYRNIKRSEQRSIWVGMAKETAHQLGTPLSSMSGWLELMRNEIDGESVGQREESLARIGQMVGEMEEDMRHLNQIASRFSQIGSIPELVLTDVGGVLEETIEYFRHRGPQFGRHDISIERQDGARSILLNAELLSWAFENLFKNAIDAMDGQTGAIQIHLVEMPEDGSVQITFRDDGRGIEPENIKRVFEPGFSTKKRGWGLGLAFVRRIIEEYHGGRISVVQSVPGEGTTFEIVLPFGE